MCTFKEVSSHSSAQGKEMTSKEKYFFCILRQRCPHFFCLSRTELAQHISLHVSLKKEIAFERPSSELYPWMVSTVSEGQTIKCRVETLADSGEEAPDSKDA